MWSSLRSAIRVAASRANISNTSSIRSLPRSPSAKAQVSVSRSVTASSNGTAARSASRAGKGRAQASRSRCPSTPARVQQRRARNTNSLLSQPRCQEHSIMTYKLMIVDDEQANLRLLERLFRRDYPRITADSGEDALRLLAQHDVALLITDQRMPGMTGIELIKHAAHLRPQLVRIILTGYTDVSALVEAINCGHVYKYVTKPWNNDELCLTVARALEFYETNHARHELLHQNQRLSARLKEMTRGFVRTIADALEAKDEYMHGHARRVRGYAVALGWRLALDAPQLEQLEPAAFLHDIGKIGTPDSLLLKPAPLTDEERADMQLHPERGARMLAGVPDMQDVIAAVRHHHENYDGTGYPEGLTGVR